MKGSKAEQVMTSPGIARKSALRRPQRQNLRGAQASELQLCSKIFATKMLLAHPIHRLFSQDRDHT